MLMTLHEDFLCMQSASAPEQNKYITLHIVFLHILSPECHLARLIFLNIYAGESHSLERSMLFIDFFFSAAMTRLKSVGDFSGRVIFDLVRGHGLDIIRLFAQ